MIKTFLAVSVLTLAAAASATAANITIVTETGADGASMPLGYYAPYAPNNNPGVGATSWTQTSTFLNVTIAASVWQVQGAPAGTINYALVQAIGYGATYATSGIAHGSITPNFAPGLTTLLTLPSLGPGTYYLVIDSPTDNTSWDYVYTGFANAGTVTTDPSVTFNGDYTARGQGVNSAYTPASGFFDATSALPLLFSVTATDSLANAPEPATGGLVLAAVAGIIRWRGRRGSQPRT